MSLESGSHPRGRLLSGWAYASCAQSEMVSLKDLAEQTPPLEVRYWWRLLTEVMTLRIHSKLNGILLTVFKVILSTDPFLLCTEPFLNEMLSCDLAHHSGKRSTAGCFILA